MFSLNCIKAISQGAATGPELNKVNAAILCRAIWRQCAVKVGSRKASIFCRARIEFDEDPAALPVLIGEDPEAISGALITVSKEWLLWEAGQENSYKDLIAYFLVATLFYAEVKTRGAGNPWKFIQELRKNGIEKGYRVTPGSDIDNSIEAILEALDEPAAWHF